MSHRLNVIFVKFGVIALMCLFALTGILFSSGRAQTGDAKNEPGSSVEQAPFSPDSIQGPKRLGYIQTIQPESPKAAKARHQRVAERRKGVPLMVHRGASKLATENTLEAYAKAMDNGADGCEVDFHRTADGVICFMHDDSTGRTMNESGKISEMSYYDLLKFKYKDSPSDNTRIPTLAAFIELVRQRAMLLHLDIKAGGLQEDLIKAFDEADIWDHIVNINAYNSDKIMANPKANVLEYKGWIEEGGNIEEPNVLKNFLNRNGGLVFCKYDPTKYAKLMGKKIEGEVALPANIWAYWTPEGVVKESEGRVK